MNLATLASILETVIADAPTLITIVENLITIFKENRTPTQAEWDEINSIVDASHDKLQNG